MQFTATSLEDIAKAFEHCAWQATAFSERLHKTKRAKLLAERERDTWNRAAAMLRATTLETESPDTECKHIFEEDEYRILVCTQCGIEGPLS